MEIIRQLKHKGIVVIPQDIRKQIKLQEGDSLSFKTEGDKIIIEKKKQDVAEFLRHFLRYRKKGKSMTLEELRKIEEESYDLH